MKNKDFSFYTKKFNLLISSMHALYRLSSMNLNQEELIKRLVRLIAQVMDTKYCSISIFDESKRFFLIKAVIQKGNEFKIFKKKKINQKEELAVYKKGIFIFKDFYIAAPLITEDISGVIILKRNRNRLPEPYSAIDRQILVTFSEQAIVAIKNSQLFEEHRKLILGSIKSLVEVLNVKAEHVYKHTNCYPRIVMAIAQNMGLNEKEIQSLYYASLLHDAGKIDIPLKILSKKRKLTGKEFNIIKTHPLKGVKFIKHLEGLKPALPIILHHHERYDGKGYPSGIRKEQIPIGARIMAVADAFEATVLGRPYKMRLTIKQAIDEMKKNSGTQFDPKVVEAFLKAVSKKELVNAIKKIRK